jgi:hypothetical protein
MKPKYYNKWVRVLHEHDRIKMPIVEFSLVADSNETAHDKGIQWIANNINKKDQHSFYVEVIDYEGEEHES